MRSEKALGCQQMWMKIAAEARVESQLVMDGGEGEMELGRYPNRISRQVLLLSSEPFWPLTVRLRWMLSWFFALLVKLTYCHSSVYLVAFSGMLLELDSAAGAHLMI